MSKPPKHSKAAEKAHPAPKRENFKTAKAYAEACRLVSEARTEFDKAAKSAKDKVSAKSKQSTAARPGGSKNKQKPETAAKPLTTAQKLDEIGEEEIFARIANCEFIHKIAASYEMSAGSLHVWLNARPEMYARAREQQADKLVADMLEIADYGLNDTYQDDNGNVRTDQDVVARSRLRVEARKWLAGKMNAKKYGDRLNLDAEVKFADMTDEQLEAKLAAAVAVILP